MWTLDTKRMLILKKLVDRFTSTVVTVLENILVNAYALLHCLILNASQN